jgi:hypothetical protein
MAPVEPGALNNNTTLLTTIALQSASQIVALAFIGGQIYRAHKDLPPSKHTRQQHRAHQHGVKVFAALAAVSLSLTVYFSLARRVLSYYQWAEHAGEHAPGTLWGGRYEAGQDVWLLERWLADTDVWREGDEVLLSSSKAWWYAQQHLVAVMAFGAFLGIEGELPRHVSRFSNS